MATLYLIPTPLVDDGPVTWLNADDVTLLNSLTHFVVENERTARRFLRKAGFTRHFDEVTMKPIDKHAELKDIQTYLAPAKQGINVGLMSEAGCPSVADPGAEVVTIAHKMNIAVKPMIGPSSLLMSLMASGLSGQSFTFHGYLPIDKVNRAGKLKAIEKLSQQHKQTQLFIEAPYRNNQLLEAIIETCHAQTLLCIACNVTAEDEFIKTKTLVQWSTQKPDLHKKPTVFLLMG